MDKRSKDLLRTLVKELRHIFTGANFEDGTILRGDLDRQLERIGIAPNGVIMPLDTLTSTHNGELRAYRIAAAQLQPIPSGQRATVRAEIVERAAYTWINRLLALRAMEARSLIRDTLRVEADYGGISEELFILRQQEPARAAGDDGGWWAVLEDACNKQAQALPGLFALDDPAAALRPSTAALLQAIDLVNGTKLPGFTLIESDAAFLDPDAIGWAYQFYQEEAKQQIDAKCKKGGKVVNRAEIAAKTQLFTEPYMVQWLLQNSLGRSYAEAYPDSTLPENWPCYIKPEKVDIDSRVELADLTLLDPCAGSGHFLRAAFDMLVAMYREQHPDYSARKIVDTVLTTHLHGIDIDPRAAQLTALTLYLRAWELVRSEERRANYTPPSMNLATTPTNLNAANLLHHLEREPRDEALKPLLEGIFNALEQADILGSLLRPREYIDEAIKKLKEDHTLELDFNLDAAELRRTILEISKHSPAELKDMLFTTLLESLQREAGRTDDVSAMLFGREAEQGMRLLQLLDRYYAVVVTNPPYLGSKHMDIPLKRYVEKYYPAGKRDLYAAFILRCLELCKLGGHVAMVTQQSWMFLGAFANIRQLIVNENTLSGIGHLGPRTFKDLSNTNALGFVLFAIHREASKPETLVPCFRLVHSETKEASLYKSVTAFNAGYSDPTIFITKNEVFKVMPGNALFYWSPKGITEAFFVRRTLTSLIDARQGLITGDNDRFLRFYWEIKELYWKPYSKGGPFRRWFGNQELVVNWEWRGTRIKELKTPLGRQKSRPQNISYYFQEGATWTGQSSYGFSVRYLPSGFIFDAKGPAFFVRRKDVKISALIALTNSKLIQFTFSAIQPTVDYGEGYLMSLPAPSTDISSGPLAILGDIAIKLKCIQTAIVPTERYFDIFSFSSVRRSKFSSQIIDALIHTIEGLNERVICKAYKLDKADIKSIFEEAGTPAGWYPLIAGYDTLPTLPNEFELPLLPQEIYDYLAQHERIHPDKQSLTRIKAKLKTLYEAEPGTKSLEQANEESVVDSSENDEEESEAMLATGAYIPIPTETFLEELSVKMELHPISVYWLLEELRAAGVRCIPEELRTLEDRLSVIILRLLGHRWPAQIEANDPVPTWAVQDGIIPLISGTGQPTLATRVRERLRAEDGDTGVPRTEQLLYELTRLTLEEWLHKKFFSHHISQFKQRPIVWHLASTPRKAPGSGRTNKRASNASRSSAFECFIYYHACTQDVLARIRTQYVEPLIQAERNQAGPSQLFGEDTATVIASERILELEAFTDQLRQIEEQGFTCNELTTFIAQEPEPLDRWCGNGYVPPRSRDEFLRQEAAWHVDINDGVRVNIAPLQLAGVLASDVLKTSDARKALVDHARWRADERRWVREGKLPRCGWMSDDVPESPHWQALHKQEDARQEEGISQDTLL